MTTKTRCVYAFLQSIFLGTEIVFSAADGANLVDLYRSHINSQSIFHLCVPVVVLAFNPADCKLGTISLLSLSLTHTHTHTPTVHQCTSCHSHPVDTDMQYSGLSLLGVAQTETLGSTMTFIPLDGCYLSCKRDLRNWKSHFFVSSWHFPCFPVRSTLLYVQCEQYSEVVHDVSSLQK